MTADDITQLENALSLMRAAGRTHIPVKLETAERLLAAERKRLGLEPKPQ
jgi:hypothetical protein